MTQKHSVTYAYSAAGGLRSMPAEGIVTTTSEYFSWRKQTESREWRLYVKETEYLQPTGKQVTMNPIDVNQEKTYVIGDMVVERIQ